MEEKKLSLNETIIQIRAKLSKSLLYDERFLEIDMVTLSNILLTITPNVYKYRLNELIEKENEENEKFNNRKKSI